MSKFESIKEAIGPIAPIALLVILFQFCTGFMDKGMLARWVIGSMVAGAGLFLFLRGVQLCLEPMGELIGSRFIYMKNMVTLIIVVFLIGAFACAADPSVAVLNQNVQSAVQSSAPPAIVFLVIVVSGIGLLLIAAIFRIIWNISPAIFLGALTTLVLIFSCFAPQQFVPLALDSGGVATGPLTVPFFLAIGLGFVSTLAGRSASTDGFGLLGVVAVGPVLGILILGICWGS